jgi:hypothetical protein
MATEFATETKLYKDFLYTDNGRLLLEKAIEQKKIWKSYVSNSNITIGTYGVNLNLIHKELKQKIKKIEITPIGLNNVCHNNADIFTKCGYTSQLGFNLTACPCGRKQSYEIHTVNKKDGKYYDFTKDFNDEKEKYFLPLETTSNALKYINLYGRKPFAINRGCKCDIHWNENPNVNETNQGDFMEHCESVKRNLDRIRVY